MTKRERPSHPPSTGGSFWLSRVGVALAIFLGIGGFLLAYEHRAHIPGTHWFLGGLLVLCILMYGLVHWGDGGDRPDNGQSNGERD